MSVGRVQPFLETVQLHRTGRFRGPIRVFKVNIDVKLCIACGVDRHNTFFGDQCFDISFVNFFPKINLKSFFVGVYLMVGLKKAEFQRCRTKIPSVGKGHNSRVSSFGGLQNIQVACSIWIVDNTFHSPSARNKTCVTM